MHTVWQDLRYGFRGLVARPGFTVLAVLTLGLGVGAATTIFSVIQNVLLDPFPYTDARRVANIQVRDIARNQPGGRSFFQLAEFLDYQEQSSVFSEVIGGTNQDVLLTTGQSTELFAGGTVTPNMFSFLGVPPAIGRGLTPDDAKPDAPAVFVMAYKMWSAHYNLDTSILGQSFTLNGVPTTLVGIMPKRFTKLGADLWRPVVLDRANPALRDEYFMFQGKLKPNVTFEQAAADLDVIGHRLAATYPRNYPAQFKVVAVPWVDNIVGPFAGTLYTIAGAVALLLLIACSNVANMLLARAAAREKEMAVRSSLGASRWRLLQQLLLESGLLAIAGAIVGCLFAYVGLKGLVLLIPEGLIPREADIHLSVPVLVFSLAAAVMTALIFGLVPALQTARRNMVEPLKDSGKGVSGGFRGGKLRGAIVVVEVALSLVLLVLAGLLMRSFVKLQTVDLGLNPDNVLVARIPLPRGQYQTAESKQRFFEELMRRLHALPGVVSATETSTLPPYGGIGTEIHIPGKTHTDRWDAMFQLVSSGYFQTLGIRMLRGRLLSDADVTAVRRVAVINQTLATRYFGTEDPIGQQIKLNLLETMADGKVANPMFEIIGVVADAKNRGIQDPPGPEVFVPYTTTGAFERGILVRTHGEPGAMLQSVKREIWAVDRGVAITLTGTLNEYLTRFSYATPRFTLVLLSVFSTVGLVLVAIGVYSVIAYTVSRQTHEIGIRLALGASHASVLRLVSFMGLRLIAIGVAIGLFLSVLGNRFVERELWTVSKHDPLTFALVTIMMAAVGLIACYVPARRAMRVDPIVALRYE
ncbi:MAG TPA: ABC transporter permease [Vicinamibacterales bacterium]